MSRKISNRFIYGIDFGTSNSSVAVWDRHQHALYDHPLLHHQEPTLLYFPHARSFYADAEKRYFGQEAIEHYIGDNMDGRLLQAIKTILPDETFKETIISINEAFGYEEFRNMTAEVTISISKSLDTTLNDARLDASDIDFVFLTGGSSLVRNIRQIFAELFGESKLHTGDTFASVGQGLALSAPLFFE